MFDGETYNVTVTWNLFGRRCYVNCFDSLNNRVFTVALIESSPALPLGAVSWSPASLTAEVVTKSPHGFPVGSTIRLTVASVVPVGYNGCYDCWVTGPSTLEFDLSVNPGAATVFGSVSQLISMTSGYFASTLIWRSGQFEVSP